jgi:predicted metal-dependent phosphoesterase TrpH
LKPNPRYIVLGLLAVALLTGTISDRSQRCAPLYLGGYRVLAADFHVHPGFFAAGAVAPWDIGFLAERQGLDALAVTPHNEIFTAKIARWFSRITGGPRILVGEEVRTVVYHLIAVGIHRRVSWNTWNDPVAHVIDDIHSQGGVAIAAHPLAEFWPAFDEQAMVRLDGSEVRHPAVYDSARAGREFEQFYRRKPMTAIGSSDFHGLGYLGMCRTWVFVTEDSDQGVMDALRAGRTVVYDDNGRAWGNPELIALAGQNGGLRERGIMPDGTDAMARISRVSGLLALLGALMFGFRFPLSLRRRSLLTERA